jgi:hypothetical protein
VRADESESRRGGRAGEFEQQAERAVKTSTGPVGEFWYFLGRTRKFWMVPIIVALLLASLIVVAGGTAVAPLIYALF